MTVYKGLLCFSNRFGGKSTTYDFSDDLDKIQMVSASMNTPRLDRECISNYVTVLVVNRVIIPTVRGFNSFQSSIISLLLLLSVSCPLKPNLFHKLWYDTSELECIRNKSAKKWRKKKYILLKRKSISYGFTEG